MVCQASSPSCFFAVDQASPATRSNNMGRKRKLGNGQLPVASLIDSHVGVTALATDLGPHVYKNKSVRWVRALAAEELHKYKSVVTPYGTVVEDQSSGAGVPE